MNFQVTSSKTSKVRDESSEANGSIDFTCGASKDKAEAIDVTCGSGKTCAGTDETEAIDVTCGRGEVSEPYLASNPNESRRFRS